MPRIAGLQHIRKSAILRESHLSKTLPCPRKPKPPEQSTAALDRVRIVTGHKSPAELTTSTDPDPYDSLVQFLCLFQAFQPIL
jgi:hypothetical protein